MKVPGEFKGVVIGKDGANLRQISTKTGAEVTRIEGNICIVSGTDKQREAAKVQIKRMVVSTSNE